MENKEKIVIKLDELPPRAEKLSIKNIQDIFGGCLTYHEHCSKDWDCCSNNCHYTGGFYAPHYCGK